MKTETLRVRCRKNLEHYPHSSTIKDFQKFRVAGGFRDAEDAMIELLRLPQKLAEMESKLDATRGGIHTL